jgi:cytochrome b561
MLRNSTNSYGTIAKSFHWLIFLLVFFMLIYGFLLDSIPKPYQAMGYNIHKNIGITILFLMILRALWAAINPRPVLPENTLLWQRRAALLVHFLLYFTLIAMPLVGWIGTSAGGRPPYIGNITLGLPITQNKALAEICFEIHENLALIIIGLVTIHILAALYHRFILHDNVLQRMLPNKFKF